MPRPVYIIQFRTNLSTRALEQELFAYALERVGSTAEFFDSYDSAIDWHELGQRAMGGSVILAGSGDFDFDGGRRIEDPARLGAEQSLTTLEPLLSTLFDTKTPTLGICFGHQLLARFCGARVSHNPNEGKVGTYAVSLTERAREHLLFAEMPQSFDAHFAHKDSVVELPTSASVIARSERCAHSVLAYNTHVYGLQFHPEIPDTHAEARLGCFVESMERNICDVAPVREAPHAPRLLDAFLCLK